VFALKEAIVLSYLIAIHICVEINNLIYFEIMCGKNHTSKTSICLLLCEHLYQIRYDTIREIELIYTYWNIMHTSTIYRHTFSVSNFVQLTDKSSTDVINASL